MTPENQCFHRPTSFCTHSCISSLNPHLFFVLPDLISPALWEPRLWANRRQSHSRSLESKEHLDMRNKRGLPHLCDHVVNPTSSNKEQRECGQLGASCLVTDKLMEPRRKLSMMLSAELRRITPVIRTIWNTNRRNCFAIFCLPTAPLLALFTTNFSGLDSCRP